MNVVLPLPSTIVSPDLWGLKVRLEAEASVTVTMGQLSKTRNSRAPTMPPRTA